MDKSYIIRIYQKDEGSVSGVVENVERQTRERFDSPDELWSLVTIDKRENKDSNVVRPEAFSSIN